MQDRKEELELRRQELAERRREHEARRRDLDERRKLYQQELQLEEEERRLADEQEQLIREHERLDYLELGLEYEDDAPDASEVAEDSAALPVAAILIGIGILVILFAAFSWFDALGNMFGIAGFVCLVAAIWRAFSREDRSIENLRIFLGGIALFWGGAILIALCGAISGVHFGDGIFSFMNILGLMGNGILIVAGLAVCIFGFVKAFTREEHGEVPDK